MNRDMLSFIVPFIFVLIAYFMGSICSAVIIAKLFHLPDPRLEGSRNPGATNMLRIAGKPYAVMVLIVDMLKGTLPAILAHLFGLNTFSQGLVVFAAVVGHIYPVFFNFQGGKGVATTLGALLGFQPLLGLFTILIWLTTAFISRISSLSAILALIALPLATYFSAQKQAFVPILLLSALVIIQHRENIKRLLNKTEPRINFKK
jgi:acyl phosphate:glycerol-3-phosphate acyltransferase